MKKIVQIFILLTLVLSSRMVAKWDYLKINNKLAITGFHFINQKVGFFFGYNNLIYKTSDGGYTWEQNVQTVDNTIIYSMNSVDSSNIWYIMPNFANLNSILFNTTDQGNSWLQLQFIPAHSIFGISLIDNTNGYICGHNNQNGRGEIYSTQNGGAKWAVSYPNDSSFVSESTKIVYSLSYLAADSSIIAVGSKGVLLKKSIYNNVWNGKFIDTNDLHKIFYFGKNNLWVFSESGSLLKSKDLGVSWENKKLEGNFGSGDMVFINDSTGYLVWNIDNTGKLYITNDAGDTWTLIYTNNNEVFTSLHCINENEIIIGCETGNILYNASITENKDWVYINYDEISVFPNPLFNNEITIFNKTGYQINQIEIYNLRLEKILQSINNFDFGKIKINVGNLVQGTYYLLIYTNKSVFFKKVIK